MFHGFPASRRGGLVDRKTMTPDAIFSVVNTTALVAWLFLIGAARWLPRAFAVVRYAVPLFFAAVYVFCLFTGEKPEGGGFRTLEQVTALFTSQWVILGGWIHYLAFDFFVGCWILEKSKKSGIPHWLIVIPMIFTFMLGPVGLALFLLLLGVRNRFFASDHPSPAKP